MITRRDALRLAGAATGPGAAPFAVSPAEAAALLDKPASVDPGGLRPSAWAADFLDPVGFAEALDGVDFRDLFENGAAAEMADYKQAFDALFDAEPALRDVPLDHPVHRLDEAGLAMWVTAWMAGVRAGAAYEHLRQAMVTPRHICERCHGHGRLWEGGPYRNGRAWEAAEACPACDRAGTVPTPAPVLTVD